MNKEIQNKIVQLQMTEQNLQNILIQKQNFQVQFSEFDNALTELKSSKEPVFKLIGPTMISIDKSKIEKELSEKKEILSIRIKNFEKQEIEIRKKFESLQSDVLKDIKK